MTLHIFYLVAFLLSMAAQATGQTQRPKPDPIRFELDASITLYKAERAAANQGLISAIQGRQEELLTSKWKLQRKVRLRKELESDLKAFEADRTLPVCEWLKGAVDIYINKMTEADETCAAAFDKASAAYLKATEKKLNLAEKVLTEKSKTLHPLPWEAETAAAKGNGTGRKQQIKEFASVLPLGGFSAMPEFQDGVQAFSNRRYVLGQVPKGLGVSRFLRIEGGGTVPISLNVQTTGELLLAISDEATKKEVASLKSLGWRKTEHAFSYGAQRPTQMFIYRKRVAKGALKLRRFGWAGPLVLLPPK